MPTPTQHVRLSLLLIAMGALLIQGCGFHLRGLNQGILPQTVSPLFIQGVSDFNTLKPALIRSIRTSQAQTTQEKGQANGVLRIKSHQSKRRTLSVDEHGGVLEYEYHEGVVFDFLAPSGEPILDEQSLSVIRSLPYESQIQEEDLLRREMRQELADRIVQRLARQL